MLNSINMSCILIHESTRAMICPLIFPMKQGAVPGWYLAVKATITVCDDSSVAGSRPASALCLLGILCGIPSTLYDRALLISAHFVTNHDTGVSGGKGGEGDDQSPSFFVVFSRQSNNVTVGDSRVEAHRFPLYSFKSPKERATKAAEKGRRGGYYSR